MGGKEQRAWESDKRTRTADKIVIVNSEWQREQIRVGDKGIWGRNEKHPYFISWEAAIITQFGKGRELHLAVIGVTKEWEIQNIKLNKAISAGVN